MADPAAPPPAPLENELRLRGPRRIRIATVLGAALLFLSGCASTLMHVTEVSPASPAFPTPADKFTILKAGEPATGPFEILGKVYVYKRAATIFEKPTEDGQAQELVAAAQQLGADGLVGLHSSIFNGVQKNSIARWTSGVAVRFLKPGQIPSRERGNFIVTMLRPGLTEKVAKDQAAAAAMSERIQESAQYWLEERGYYAQPAEVAAAVDSADLAAMDDSTLSNLGARWADLVLLVGLKKTSTGYYVLATTKSATLSAVLYSKSQRKIVWESTTTGRFGAGLGVVDALFGLSGNVVYPTMCELFKYLPAISVR